MKLCEEEANGTVNKKLNEEANEVESHVGSHEECLVGILVRNFGKES